ncbi:hypothetical protein EDC01DRAFT_722736 [Geopyxis carbonaria]|nr:hypothetical protein EDC01DRAFT_722736 [Geopyxis carbonaria]
MRPLLPLLLLLFAATPLTATLLSCLHAASIPLSTPSSPSYPSLSTPYNLRTPPSPAPLAIALPHTRTHIAAALHCATLHAATVSVRSGGHSYAAFSLSATLILDLRHFRTLAPAPTPPYLATIGAGRRLGDVATALHAVGRAIPHGLCPGVGLAGHALHGGFGYTSRMWGTSLDAIRSLDVVLPNSTLATVTAASHPDLFWALRGAGESFGVVTALTVATHPAPQGAVVWNCSFPSATTPAARARVFAVLQNWALAHAPPELAVRMLVVPPRVDAFIVSGAYWGPAAAFDTLIAPLLALWPKDTVARSAELPYLAALRSFTNGEALPQPVDYDRHDLFFAKSLTYPRALPAEAVGGFFEFMEETAATAPVGVYVVFDLYDLPKPAVGSSYGAEDAVWTLQLMSLPWPTGATEGAGEYPDAGYGYMDDLVRSFTGASEGESGSGYVGDWGAYVNYVDDTLSPREAHRLYYGEKYGRLLRIRRKVDPRGVLWGPQNVGVGDEE